MNLPDRDALLYFQNATGCFEEAGELHTAGDLLAAATSIKAGIYSLTQALQVATTRQARDIIIEALNFWPDTLAEIEAELAVEADDEAWRQTAFAGV